MEENMEMNLDFELIPTVHLEVESVGFSADVIRLYDMPHDIVRKAMNVMHGPAQMEEMLNVFKLAVMDQNKLAGLELMTFAEVADMLGSWALKSTVGDEEEETPKLLDEVDELVELIEGLTAKVREEGPKKRGRHASDAPVDTGIDSPLNDPGDGIDPFAL